MSREWFVLIPSLHPTGPVKGAIALANALANWRKVHVVTVKAGPGADARIDPRVKLHDLSPHTNLRARQKAYRALLLAAGGRDKVSSVSMCFSADALNFFCRNYARICSSVRGNLLHNYRLDYGWSGVALAVLHLSMLRRFDDVVAMTESMAAQVRKFVGRNPAVIGNFVDEPALDEFRHSSPQENSDHPYRFIFIGSLTVRKCPLLLLEAIALLNKKYPVALDIVGDGPLRKVLQETIQAKGLDRIVSIHGHLKQPHFLLAQADAFVLPSSSEGMSRACLEALYLGVPCVLRKVDGNVEIIQPQQNGFLFMHDVDLSESMLQAAQLARHRHKEILLPPQYRQATAAEAYLKLVEV